MQRPTLATHAAAWAVHLLTAATWLHGVIGSGGAASPTDRKETLVASIVALVVQAFMHRTGGGPPANGSGTSPFPLAGWLRQHYPALERYPSSAAGASGAAGRSAAT